MYQHILVPLDESKCSEAVLPQVEALARQTGATVTFIEVVTVEPTMVMTGPYEMVPDWRQEEVEQRACGCESYLENWQQRFQNKGIEADYCIEYGSIVSAILETAAREGVDLIAMGSHGRTGFSRFIHGSVTAEVMQKAEQPVLIVK